MTLSGLAALTGFEIERIGEAVSGLSAEGLLDAGPGATAGRPRGRVRLAS